MSNRSKSHSSRSERIQKLAAMDCKAIERQIDQELRDFMNGKVKPRRVVEPNPELEEYLDKLYEEE